MLSNKEIAGFFNQLASLMELHKDNPFKIKSYQSAYISLRKQSEPLAELEQAELEKIKGIGKSTASKIREIVDTGSMEALQKYYDKTPEGIRDMLKIKGFGAKKIRTLWKELGAESPIELLYACNENRLVALNGFGLKTQADLKTKIEYFLQSKSKFHYAALETEAESLLGKIKEIFPETKVSFAGAYRRKNIVLKGVEYLIDLPELPADFAAKAGLSPSKTQGSYTTEKNTLIHIHLNKGQQWGTALFNATGPEVFTAKASGDFKEEKDIFASLNLPILAPELRDLAGLGTEISQNTVDDLLKTEDIRGVIHSHTTYSDGIHSLREMAEYAKAQGFGYIGITDHSKAAFYANGLQPERVLAQFAEIDQLNQEMPDFRILKGIESDILNDGSLDYEADLLAQFDFIIASVHTNLKMDEAKANERLIKAIENPYTTMLGHPTGRLLLARKGYPIDHHKIIDACAANGVSIEINANPYRLDIDWEFVPYALEKGVLLSINPDAHSTGGIHDIKYGVFAGRKGGLTKEMTLNTREVDGFLDFCKK